jgi:hypothetical protein
MTTKTEQPEIPFPYANGFLLTIRAQEGFHRSQFPLNRLTEEVFHQDPTLNTMLFVRWRKPG